MAQQKKKTTAKKAVKKPSSPQHTKSESSESMEDQTETMDSTSAEDEDQDQEATDADSGDQNDGGGLTTQEAAEVAAERKEPFPRADHREGVPKGRVLDPDDELEFDAEEIEDSNFVRVTEDVYRKTYHSRAMRPSYRLVFRAGTMLTKQQVERIEKTGEVGNAFTG